MISLGVDIGGTGCKCVAFRDDGTQLAIAYAEYPLAAGTVNLPPDILASSVFRVIAQCTAQLDNRAEIAAITISSFGESFVAVDEADKVLGYAFCVFQQHINNNILTDVKTLYIDDLCVEEALRGQHIGKQLYEYVLAFAKGQGCYNVTLNVWACNESAMRFYQKCGLLPQKVGMEKIIRR